MKRKIPFNSFFHTAHEKTYLMDVLDKEKLSGVGVYAQKCNNFFYDRYGFKNIFLTPSCTAALETAAMLMNIEPGDEVIMPSYTFVSTANAFALHGAKVIFADSGIENPNIDAKSIEKLITSKTKAIVPVHYAGIACDMDEIVALADKYNLFVVEDAAHAIDAYYKAKPLGSFGHFSTFSFHETKNITCGEGGMLVINDQSFIERAAKIIEKGTNRKDFNLGKVKKYEWVDLGSSYRLGELNAALLFSQLEELDLIQKNRNMIWDNYYTGLKDIASRIGFSLPNIPELSKHNSTIFYLICDSEKIRDRLIAGLTEAGVNCAFHYQPLHLSPYYTRLQKNKIPLVNAENYGNCLVRLPMHANMSIDDANYVIEQIKRIQK